MVSVSSPHMPSPMLVTAPQLSVTQLSSQQQRKLRYDNRLANHQIRSSDQRCLLLLILFCLVDFVLVQFVFFTVRVLTVFHSTEKPDCSLPEFQLRTQKQAEEQPSAVDQATGPTPTQEDRHDWKVQWVELPLPLVMTLGILIVLSIIYQVHFNFLSLSLSLSYPFSSLFLSLVLSVSLPISLSHTLSHLSLSLSLKFKFKFHFLPRLAT